MRRIIPMDLKHKFIVDLQQHCGSQPAGGDGWFESNHGLLDQVGGRSLNYSVDGSSLGHVFCRPVVLRIPEIARRRFWIVRAKPVLAVSVSTFSQNAATP